MREINYLTVVVAAIAAFVMSSVWYIIFGKARMELLGKEPNATADMRRVPAWKKLIEFVRGLIVAYVLAHLVALLGIVEWRSALQIAVWLWIGFPFMILVGSVLWDNRPWKLAAIHAGDWLMKILLMAFILSRWR
jgi:hypothetical protein